MKSKLVKKHRHLLLKDVNLAHELKISGLLLSVLTLLRGLKHSDPLLRGLKHSDPLLNGLKRSDPLFECLDAGTFLLYHLNELRVSHQGRV